MPSSWYQVDTTHGGPSTTQAKEFHRKTAAVLIWDDSTCWFSFGSPPRLQLEMNLIPSLLSLQQTGVPFKTRASGVIAESGKRSRTRQRQRRLHGNTHLAQQIQPKVFHTQTLAATVSVNQHPAARLDNRTLLTKNAMQGDVCGKEMLGAKA